MTARGGRFAIGEKPGQDAAGHSLPSDGSMRYVELQVICQQHEGEPPMILGAWWIESHHEVFDPTEVNERANKAVIDRQVLTGPDGSSRLRFVMRCPKCGNAPVLRQETIDAALVAIYQKDSVAKVVQYPI